ncbi:MAG: hypothetical protein WD403_09000 [Pirellulales bacterium]
MLTLLAVWLGVWTHGARRQRQAVEAVTALGGKVAYAFEPNLDPRAKPLPIAKPAAPAWLRRALGDDYFSDVTAVFFINTDISDAEVETIAQLTQLRTLWICEPKVTDAALEKLAGLDQLMVLNLRSTQATSDGLAHLAGLAELRYLNLGETLVEDDGLHHLIGLKKLEVLECVRDPANATLAFAMEEPTEIECTNTPLYIMLDILQARHGIPPFEFELGQADLTPEVPINMKDSGLTLRDLLAQLLDPHGLGWRIEGQRLLITPAADAGRRSGLDGLRKSLPALKEVKVDW